MNYKSIRKTAGIILCVESAFMVPPLLLALVDGDRNVVFGFLIAIAAVLAFGLPMSLRRGSTDSLDARDGCVTVAMAWLTISVFGAIPFYASGVIGSVFGAIYETVSGFSTTGATILGDVESVPRGILLWRSITNWVGGMGVLVFVMAVAPVAREGGSMFLLRAEFPGPMTGKLVPRMQKSSKILYEMYILMTLVQIILLVVGSVPLFDAVNISLSTVSTGGFSIKNDSLISYSRYAQTVTLIFMTMCSISFSIFYCLVIREFARVKESRELRVFIIFVVIAAVLVGFNATGNFESFGEGAHHTVFQVISIISTTAFQSVESGIWSQFAWAVLIILMITGPMAGSTGGGMKLSRVMILGKSTYRAIKKTITPGSVHLIHHENEIVDEETVSTVNSFAVVYLMTMVFTGLVLALDGISFSDGMAVAISCLGNIGANMDSSVFPFGAAGLSVLSKLVLCFDMFLGRLEFFPLLIIFAPETWRK